MEIGNDIEFKMIARQFYDNPQAFSFTEFEQDFKKFDQVSNMIYKYNVVKEPVNLRLLLNNIIIIHNLFGRFTSDGLFYKTSNNNWDILKTLLSFLSFIPPESKYNNISNNQNLMQALKEI